MAFSVETQVKAKNTYALLVYSLSEVGALFGTGSFVKAAVLDLATFDVSATSAQPIALDKKVYDLSRSYNELRDLASSFASDWAEVVAKDDEALALEILNAVEEVVSYARERVFG
jgi:hypothetical protein